ncbi:unnamed protein product [Rotaria sordida]|uniref:Uncharacterized protein n=1 Tax=Rotaria sordida TaxID=392033 RepID=A0A820E8Z6_9BILA|nr:unnamed protein product [Rotaria sordida]
MATLTINKKKLVGEIVVAGTFARCQAELNKLQRASQSVEKDKMASIDHDNILGNYEFNQNDDVVERNEDDGQTDEDLYEESEKKVIALTDLLLKFLFKENITIMNHIANKCT